MEVSQPWRKHLLLALSTLLGLGGARLLLGATAEQVFLVGQAISYQCQLKLLTGLNCPGCGGTRSFVLALHGEWLSAWQLNPVGVVVVLGLLGFTLSQLLLVAAQLGYGQGLALSLRRLGEPKWLAGAAYVLVGLAFGQWLLRLVW